MKKEMGILGGGQLARMLGESATRMGLRVIARCHDLESPASETCAEIVSDVRTFLERSEIVVFENEFVDCTELRSLSPDDSQFRPPLSAIETLQDKLTQKKLLKRASVPTSPFVEVQTIEQARKALGGDIVLKWSRHGYDGKGVFVLKAREKTDRAQEFCDQAKSRGITVYAEKRVDFRRELAIIAVAPLRGSPVYYPLVISSQEGGICRTVIGPATKLGVPKKLQARAEDAARKIAKATGLCGSFGIEFFETKKGELLVNEIAPRVHNTGHPTQNAFGASQFENHWRAVLGLPLFDPKDEPAADRRFFAMLNILGPAGVSTQDGPTPVAPQGTFLHWYGKKEIRPGRKLGHINAIASSALQISALLKKMKKCEKDWIDALKRGNS